MNSSNPLIKKYYKQTKAKIPTAYPNRKDILNQIHSSLIQYETEHSEFTYDDLTANFGEPSEFANSFIEFDSPDEIRKKLMDTKKKYTLTIVSIIIIIVIILISTIILMINQGERATEILITTEVEYDPETESTEETNSTEQ